MENAPDQSGRFDGVEHVFRFLEIKDTYQFLLGLLRMPHVSLTPERLWNDAILDVRQEPLQPRHTVAVRPPPYPTVFIEFTKAFRGYAKIIANRRREFLAGRTRYFVRSETVVITRSQIARRPDAARILVRILVPSNRALVAFDQVGLPVVQAPCINQNEVVILRKVFGGVFRREDFLPDHTCDEVLLPEHLVHQGPQPVDLVVVDGDEDRAVVAEQLAQQLQARQHHAAPLVVAGQVVAVHDAAQPLLHHRRVHAVVVGPALVAGVVGRVDGDALDLAVARRQQRLERQQVVALDDQVVVQARPAAQPARADRRQLVEGRAEVEVLDEHPALEVQRRHGVTPFSRRQIRALSSCIASLGHPAAIRPHVTVISLPFAQKVSQPLAQRLHTPHLTLPDDADEPAHPPQGHLRTQIPFSVRRDPAAPVLGATPRQRSTRATRVSVPKAAMNENHLPPTRKDHVR